MIVAYNDPADPSEQWIYTSLGPGQNTPWNLDVDGVRAAGQSGAIMLKGFFSDRRHQGWWKIRNGQNAIIKNGSGSLVMTTIADMGLGRVTWVAPAEPMSDDDFEFDWANTKVTNKFP